MSQDVGDWEYKPRDGDLSHITRGSNSLDYWQHAESNAIVAVIPHGPHGETYRIEYFDPSQVRQISDFGAYLGQALEGNGTQVTGKKSGDPVSGHLNAIQEARRFLRERSL